MLFSAVNKLTWIDLQRHGGDTWWNPFQEPMQQPEWAPFENWVASFPETQLEQLNANGMSLDRCAWKLMFGSPGQFIGSTQAVSS
jgi:hypothetical protein